MGISFPYFALVGIQTCRELFGTLVLRDVSVVVKDKFEEGKHFDWGLLQILYKIRFNFETKFIILQPDRLTRSRWRPVIKGRIKSV
ncbi:hypothetical protein AKJ65_00130 [candidate division MSBL1 archaeon SCGC-AAA259E19]|uniref:Uncharacterized protein n=1 Tax=candidate division MSBL1 archaeon SCGC-AAA259E19 TaxID=1698264 RepID=A0A133UP10_9EURY|nr:hypothetical protein AKJ65_00130 [candidate division MSBL1 archaeon SCGC-AAA259E19]